MDTVTSHDSEGGGAHMDKVYQHMIQVREGCPRLHIQTQLLFKVSTKTDLKNTTQNQSARLHCTALVPPHTYLM